jgi:hypothetical protein
MIIKISSFLFTERELLTPSLDGLILPGITRLSILELTRGWGEFKVTEQKITMSEVIHLMNENRVRLEYKNYCTVQKLVGCMKS